MWTLNSYHVIKCNDFIEVVQLRTRWRLLDNHPRKVQQDEGEWLQDTKLGHRNSDYMFGDVITRPKSPRDAKNVKMVINLQSRRI